MATLLLSAIGTLVGGPIGGAIGALVGRTVDGAILGHGTREGPRLKELAISTSSYGTAVPRVHGRMRVPGTIIWATDLVEHRDKQGGGKGKPSVVTYSYTASLAVALSSRPLAGIGRIWADGNLLRGAAGDFKTGGTMRFYSGTDDQSPDPLLTAAEAESPAYRGLAYVVFEDLQLGDFGNRIPALTFEVFAPDQQLSVAGLLEDFIDDLDADVPLPGIAGLSCESPLSDLLAQIDPALPLDCDVSGDLLSIGSQSVQTPIVLAEAATSVADDAFGGASGFSRRRQPPSGTRPEILRYYDIDRDYQPGQQRAPGRPQPGQPASIELPVAMAASDARVLAERIARRASWARQTISWRTAELDARIRPGSLAKIPNEPGTWRVNDWEWRENGVELTLLRHFEMAELHVGDADAGQIPVPIDALSGPTVLHAFELPWDGTGTGDSPAIFAALSSASAGWSGAALFVDQGDGQLVSLGSSRLRATVGQTVNALATVSPHLFDRNSAITVQLIDASQILVEATPRQLAAGANRALVGGEVLQFLKATSLGAGQWRLEGLLRGRAGTESAIAGHASGEPFVLLDDSIVPLDTALIGDWPNAEIVAIGLADEDPVRSSIANRGVTRRPLFPVHAFRSVAVDGSANLTWTRRSRGSWTWLDSVDSPLHEQTESYEVSWGSSAKWTVGSAALTVDAATLAGLQTAEPGAHFSVRQQGTYALSDPTLVQ
jgi:hypothetical protein